MATFTMELRELLDDPHYPIFDMRNGERYPIFDEGYRLPLNKKIIDHYKYREIGVETPDLFIFFLNRKMREIMPFYNQLYRSEQLTYDPLLTIDIKTVVDGTATMERDSTSDSTTESVTSAKSRAVSSQMPQTQLSGNADYADSASDANSTSNVDGTANETGNVSGTESESRNSTTSGRQGQIGTLLTSWRSAMLNIDMMVVNELEELFMQIWNNGDVLGQSDVIGIVPGLWRYPI